MIVQHLQSIYPDWFW